MTYWEKLLLSQKRIGKSGLTIPFIIGSQNYTNTVQKDNIEELLLDIVQNSNFEITLRICADIHTLILEKRNPKNLIYYPKFENHTQSNFSVAKTLKESLGDSVEEIIMELIIEFQDLIDNELFSAQPSQDKRIASWAKFSELEDIPFILMSLNEQIEII